MEIVLFGNAIFLSWEKDKQNKKARKVEVKKGEEERKDSAEGRERRLELFLLSSFLLENRIAAIYYIAFFPRSRGRKKRVIWLNSNLRYCQSMFMFRRKPYAYIIYMLCSKRLGKINFRLGRRGMNNYTRALATSCRSLLREYIFAYLQKSIQSSSSPFFFPATQLNLLYFLLVTSVCLAEQWEREGEAS